MVHLLVKMWDNLLEMSLDYYLVNMKEQVLDYL